MILVIDCCIRGKDSTTREFYKSYLNKFCSKDEIKTIELSKENLKPLTVEDLKNRDNYLASNDLKNEMFKYAREVRNADQIIIAAPYWDLSFPSLLKVFIEKIMIPGITFKYVGAEAVGLCKAQEMIVFSTAGGFVGSNDNGFEYLRGIANMIGIPDYLYFVIEGLDIDPSKREEILDQGISAMINYFKKNIIETKE